MFPLNGASRGKQRLREGTVARLQSGHFDGCARGIEVGVVGDAHPWPTQRLDKQVLGGTPLRNGNNVRKAEDGADPILEPRETPAPGVRLVSANERGPLGIAHRGRAAVREEVDGDILRGDPKQVVPGA